jgi:hypothetical protein
MALAGRRTEVAEVEHLLEQAARGRGGGELQADVRAPVTEKGRVRRALGRVIKVLRGAGESGVRGIAIGMGDELIRQVGGQILKELPQ